MDHSPADNNSKGSSRGLMVFTPSFKERVFEQRCKPFGSGTPLPRNKGPARGSLQLQIPQPPSNVGSRVAEKGRNPLRQADPTTYPCGGFRRRNEMPATATRPIAALFAFPEKSGAVILWGC